MAMKTKYWNRKVVSVDFFLIVYKALRGNALSGSLKRVQSHY